MMASVKENLLLEQSLTRSAEKHFYFLQTTTDEEELKKIPFPTRMINENEDTGRSTTTHIYQTFVVHTY